MAGGDPVARLAANAAQEYRAAVAAQVEGSDPTEHWDAWEAATAVLLLTAWASGAGETVRKAGIPASAIGRVQARFDRIPDEVTFGFEPGPAAEAVDRLVKAVPLTRERWEELIAAAREAARELRESESAEALEKILDRSPEIARIVRPVAGSAAPAGFAPVTPRPDEVKPPPPSEATATRRNIGVQRAVQGSFFVTGMTPRQVKQTQRLLAEVIRGEETVSTAGKRIERIGVGDFVSMATLETGTDLTSARLETVYRTNLNRAQSQGRLDVCRDELVQKFVPLMRFSATRDSRTRPTHRAMDGFIATVAQIDAQGIPTPLGFNCRCAWVPVSIAEGVRLKLCDEDGAPDFDAIRRYNGARQRLVDTAAVPDPGFISG
jgi:SPP1 gp7 family putative phage head morphogenesis protein